MAVLTVLAALVAAVGGWRAWRRLRYFLHIFQLEGYKLDAYGAWLRPRLTPLVLAPSHAAGAALVALVALAAAPWAIVLGMIAWLIAFASDAPYSARPKKPLVFTARMRRLAATAAVLGALPVAGGIIAGLGLGAAGGVAAYLLGWLLADLGAPLWVAAAGLLMRPVEARVQRGFKQAAREKLARQSDLCIVGIAGSYGKTSTKFATAEILRQRFNTLATPGSYNTPMGLCLVINNQLRPDHRVLVLEYGIRRPGDMDELLALARPQIAAVTSLGVDHLATMGSTAAIDHENGKLVEALPPGGTAVLNLDDARVAALRARVPPGVEVYGVSTRAEDEAQLRATHIRYGPYGATFDVETGDGECAGFTTRLLGRHNVLNILVGLAIGRAMGLRLRQMVPAVERIRPVEHRLELRDEGGVTVIDDAFNANPVGARNAVEILGQFGGRRRVIVTPGMIELGERQVEENRLLGHHIAEHLRGEEDFAVLVGPRQTEPIRRGLAEAGFPAARVRVVGSLFEARDLLQTLLRPGDVVLFENDLPDHYDERA